MRSKLYGIFSNIDDARQALGNIKKESLNLADLTVVFADNSETLDHRRESDLEFARDLGDPALKSNRVWPGLQSQNLSGIGKIKIGSSQPWPHAKSPKGPLRLDEDDLAVIGPQIKANRVAAIVECDVDLLPKLRFLLESQGAFVISSGE
jgi:hypothetical protein